ncbi:zf-CCHC domain-containing protein [Tanacetum coccineum]|uniref:Zf-CCHC domain-containing protein n=1 Tax=Tanacetum coccineum TaxID=301880 RepID=A0ABQ5F897_9ASTR
MSTQKVINAIRAQRLANTHDPLALMANTQTPFHPDHSSHITYIQHPQPNNNFFQQPSFNMNYMLQPMQNPEDISNPTTALDMALELMSKAFQLNNTTATNNSQRSSSNPYYSQIAQSGHLVGQNAVQNQGTQNVRNQNGLSVVPGIANQHGNGNVVATQAEGNSNEINGNQIRCYNCRGEGYYASNCIVKPRKRDAAYIQTQLQITQKDEA